MDLTGSVERVVAVQIQEYLISAVQNIQVILRYGYQPKRSLVAMVNQVKGL